MSNHSISFQKYVPNGKISTRPGEITPQYVTAVSRIYLNRADSEQEYIIEETGIIERAAYDSLAKCYAEASRMAYQNALSRVADGDPLSSGPVSRESESPDTPEDKATVPEPESTEKNETRASEPVQEPDDAPPQSPESGDGQGSTVKKLDLNLVSAASLMGTDTPQPEDDGDDPIQKARETKITILGKAHECYNWPAGKILDELPEIIVKFAHRYSGENKVEKEALLALYPEAVRRCEKAS